MTFHLLEGFQYKPDYLKRDEQEKLLIEIQKIVSEAPFYRPTMPGSGKPFSVRMSNCGVLGWVSDKDGGYRYQRTHPETGNPWPAMPEMLIKLWQELTEYPSLPEACLINLYEPKAKMGLHCDQNEEDFDAPVLSVSLGDTALFRIGGLKRTDPTRSFNLQSGDVVLLGGRARLAYHGIDRLRVKTSSLLQDMLPEGGRLNLTLRRVTKAQTRQQKT